MTRKMYEYIPSGDLFEIRELPDRLMVYSYKFGILYLEHSKMSLFRFIGIL